MHHVLQHQPDREQKAIERAMHQEDALEESKRIELLTRWSCPWCNERRVRTACLACCYQRGRPNISVLRWGLLSRYIRTEEEAKEFPMKAPTFTRHQRGGGG